MEKTINPKILGHCFHEAANFNIPPNKVEWYCCMCGYMAVIEGRNPITQNKTISQCEGPTSNVFIKLGAAGVAAETSGNIRFYGPAGSRKIYEAKRCDEQFILVRCGSNRNEVCFYENPEDHFTGIFKLHRNRKYEPNEKISQNGEIP